MWIIKTLYKIIGLTGIALYTTLTAQSQQYTIIPDANELKDKINSATAKITTIQSDFVQTKHLDIISEDIKSSGKFYFRNDLKLRWEYTSPFSYQIIINKNNISIKDDKNVSNYNTESNKAFEEINKMITSIVTGTILSKSSEYKTLFYSGSNDYKTVLTPVDNKMLDYISKIEVFFDKTDYTVSKIALFEPEGDFTSIVFTNKKLNQIIPDALFGIN